MTPAEKAKELVDKMYYMGRYDEKENYNLAMAWERAKQCALIAVDEHLKGMSFTFGVISYASLKFWKDVKQEIEKL